MCSVVPTMDATLIPLLLSPTVNKYICLNISTIHFYIFLIALLLIATKALFLLLVDLHLVINLNPSPVHTARQIMYGVVARISKTLQFIFMHPPRGQLIKAFTTVRKTLHNHSLLFYCKQCFYT